MAYADTSNFFDRYDARLIAQLSNDNNSTGANTTTIGVMLEDGKAEILTACLKGSIYSASDLDALVNSGDTQLVRLNCDVALKFLCDRRVGGTPKALQGIIDRANDMLDALRSGAKVLNVTTNRAADVPAVVVSTGVQQSNLGDITQNDFWSNRSGTNTVDYPGT